MDRHRIEIVQLLPPPSDSDDEIGVFQDRQMLTHRLSRHVESRAELAKRLTVLGTQSVEQFSPARIGQRLEHRIHGVSHALQYATIWLRVKGNFAALRTVGRGIVEGWARGRNGTQARARE